MSRACPLLLLLVTLVACETAPTAPTVIERPSVAPVTTAQPCVWDSAEELAAWVSNGVSTGAMVVLGEGTDAVIRADITGSTVTLHGPDLVPPPSDVQSMRIRYRWAEFGTSDTVGLSSYLRPPTLTASTILPRLFPPAVSSTELRSGVFVERTFVTNSTVSPPFTVRYAVITVTGSTRADPPGHHNAVEIDRIEIVRSTGSTGSTGFTGF